MAEGLKERLTAEAAEVAWTDLRPHAGRGALFLIDAVLDLVDVGVAIARDDKASVEAWLAEARLVRPTVEQLDAWEAKPSLRFRSLIVQPFVLAQLAGTHDGAEDA